MFKKVEEKNDSLALFAFLAGIFVGAAATLLLAPMSGKEARKKIKSASNTVKKRTQEVTGKAASALGEGTSVFRKKCCQ